MRRTDPLPHEPDLPRTMRDRPVALRTGWTTGTCASAAAKAATLLWFTGEPVRQVEVALPSGQRVSFETERCEFVRAAASGVRKAEAVVVKDAGDDPDVTHGAHLTATVDGRTKPGIALDGGVGVGVVTRPGLGLELGGPAINPVPRRMILAAVGEAVEEAGGDVARAGLRVVISVPEGERMARKTTNGKLGILGGISILGTSGIVRPFSTASWRASVEQAVSVVGAQGAGTVVLCTGGRTEKGARALFPELPKVCFVEVGDFTGAALRKAVEHGVKRVVFVGMVGKLTKLAAGVLMTHYTRSKIDADLLGEVTLAAGGEAALAERVVVANTARHAYEIWDETGLLAAAGAELCARARAVMRRFSEEELEAKEALEVEVAMVDFRGQKVIARTWQ